MISCHVNKNKSKPLCVNGMRLSMYGSILHQKSIKQYCQNQKKLIKRPAQQKQKLQKGSEQKIVKFNDQNCSFYGNTIEIEKKRQNKELLAIQKKISHEFQQEQQMKQNKSKQLISLKKKIKKCSSQQMGRSHSYFREKVIFIRKSQSTRLTQHENLEGKLNQVKTQDRIETYPVYRDSEVFSGYMNKELRNRIVAQRMDNDGDTDEQQIEKFVYKIKTQFLDHLQKVRKQKQYLKSNHSIQQMELVEINQFNKY